MRVELTRAVDGVGKAGEVVKVKDGYGMRMIGQGQAMYAAYKHPEKPARKPETIPKPTLAPKPKKAKPTAEEAMKPEASDAP